MARKTDVALLNALLDCGRLTDEEDRAFRGMLGRIDGLPKKLTPPQKEWAQGVYERLHLEDEEPAENLISSGAYKPTKAELEPRYPWELAPKPRKPPGRKCPEGTGACKLCDPCKNR